MLFERIESEGLAHNSYLIGDSGSAVVIDPRRDCEVYVERARAAGLPITRIFETHRNEDYVAGSVELAERTGAQIWHADSYLPYAYGEPVEDGETWTIGRLKLQALHTPGHTPGSMSYLLHEPGGAPWAVFSGDTLFASEVGRVDLLGMDRAEELAGLLYDSIFGKLLPLGDGVLVCPAHGAGSACGPSIADRPWTTIGLERQVNPRLDAKDKAEFVANIAIEMERPPYFRQMERLNVEGAPILGRLPNVPLLWPIRFARMAEEAFVLDTRMDLGFAAAHVPGALSIYPNGLASYAGWFLPYDRPLLLVAEGNDIELTVRKLLRLGYDRLAGQLAGGMLSWHVAGQESAHVELLTVQALCRLLDAGKEMHILDVRSIQEVQAMGIPGAQHIHITLLPSRLDEVPRDRPIYIFCGTGMRSMIGASVLERAGWSDVKVILGGLAGWNSVRCPLRGSDQRSAVSDQ